MKRFQRKKSAARWSTCGPDGSIRTDWSRSAETLMRQRLCNLHRRKRFKRRFSSQAHSQPTRSIWKMCLKNVFLVAMIATFSQGFVHAQYLGYAFHADAKKGEQLYRESGCQSSHVTDRR